MIKNFTYRFLLCITLIVAFCANATVFAQQKGAKSKSDSVIVQQPLPIFDSKNERLLQGVLDSDPPNLVRTIQYDPATNRYILTEKVGNLLYRPLQYLTFSEYLELMQRLSQRQYWQQLSDNYAYASQQPGFIPRIEVRSHTFEQVFGSNTIDIRPQGSAEMIFAGQVNKNQNPLYSTSQRDVFNFNFDQKIQMNVTGTIGDKLKISTNYNTDAQFQFENQVKLDYTGHPDEIIQKIEAGTVSMPLNTTLISGSQALFGLKTKLKFGKLDVTSIFSQQRSQAKTITISNGTQQGEFRLTPADYEANRHFFLAEYFRDNYDKALANIPIISSNITITKIEVWTTNRTNVTTGSRDILALLDLGENKPYNTSLVQGGGAYSNLPAGFLNNSFPTQSNSLLRGLPANARLTNANDIASYFQATGANDNYAKLTYARKLTDKEFTLHPQLGYISLNYPLNNDEVLAVAYQYTYNGKQYQVGEFSTDLPVNPNTPQVLYVKLLKNTVLKTNLPTWKLMMKNIYTLGAYQVSPNSFKMTITRLDDKSGIEKPVMDEGQNTKGKLWLQITDLDNLNAQNYKQPDGYFDFLEGITIDSQNGRIMFPVVEPFGSDLAKQFLPAEQSIASRYVYQPLYDSTKTMAQQLFPNLNRYIIKGTYTSQAGSDFSLNATNIPQGSVIVVAGATKLVEGTDYTIDYNIGHIRILNQALLQSGQPISVRIENNELFGVQQKSLYGTRLDYHVNNNLLLGGTIMHLTEQPITQNEIVGQESVSNTMWGLDANYTSSSRMLTKLVNKIPFITTKAPSSVALSGEFAQLIAGSPAALNFAGAKNGTAYLDDFENSSSVIDIKSSIGWQISGTPQLFPESQVFNDLSYGFNRARLAFYNIDPIFYTNSSSVLPNYRTELSNHYVRQILETEVFPYKQSVTGQPLMLPTLDVAYYPTVRGPYNYTTTGLNGDGTLQNPKGRWGGIFRKIETNDFESLNVVYIEFWMMDPFIYKPNSQGGDLYFNLGDISEDILKDGRKSMENGIPVNGDLSQVDETNWGRVPKLTPVVNAFDNNSNTRAIQDVGLDGLGNKDEQTKFATIVQQVKGQLNPQAAANFAADPSSDDYQYYRGGALETSHAGILQRYAKYNGTEGNSKTADQSQAELGLSTSASTSLPDEEDINRDNDMNQDDEYFQYRVSIRPADMVVGKNYITDKVTSQVKLANGTTQSVNWYQFKVPIAGYESKVGNISDFKSVRFVRMFMTNFADTAVLRFASLQFQRGEWRTYNSQNDPSEVIADPSINNPPLDNSTLDVTTVNIEENGTRSPIPYVVPPGIQRQRNYNNLQTDTKLNEQSLSVTVTSLRDGYSRAAFKTFANDLRHYKHVQMFIHAEGTQLKTNDVSAFIRFGVDYQDNYYEYEIPMTVTTPGTSSPDLIWPAENNLDLDLTLLTNAKLARDRAKLNGQPWPLTVPFTVNDGKNKITIKGEPDLSRVASIMLGIRNPLKAASTTTDDGADKTATLWFDELRLTDINQRNGWAATGRIDTKLADFADVTFSGSKKTIGFGSIDQTVEDRSMSDDQSYDLATSMELGKFFPAKSGIHIPFYFDLSNQISVPEYDPARPDVLLSQSLRMATSTHERDSIRNAAEDFTARRSFNFTNVHKTRTNTNEKAHPWDIENFNLSYAFTEYDHHDFTTTTDLEKTYNATMAYNYTTQPKYFSPFDKIIKSNTLALLRDINLGLWPSRLNFSINFNRFYSENTPRSNDPDDPIPTETTFNKNFLITRTYGIGWNLTKSLQMDIDATNLSTVDEPAGRLNNGLKRDSLWDNLLKGGRTTNYYHTLNFSYNVPLNKIPGMDWATVAVRYSTNFTWQSAAAFTLVDPTFDVGNSIQNRRTIQVNPTLNVQSLYNKFTGLRKATDDNSNGIGSALLKILTSIKNVSGTYTETQGTFLPGYLPQSNFAGEDFSYRAPGLGFLLGSQADIRGRALAGGWITSDTLQNQQYITTLNRDMHVRALIQPFKDLRIELLASKTEDRTYQSNFKYNPLDNEFENESPVTTGDYTISYMTLPTAFEKISGLDNSSPTFQKMLNDRTVISQRLGVLNPNSKGTTAGYADGYSANQQDVLVSSFIAAYTGKSASGVSLSSFPEIPIPNWDITYNGLSKLPWLNDVFDALDLKHGYRSTYSVSSFNTLLQYTTSNGAVNARDENNDFLPQYQFSQVSLYEQFVPLIGLNARFKNSMTANLEFRKSRLLNLDIANSQLAQQNENIVVFGWGYHTRNFRFPFGLFSGVNLKNDMNFKLDVSVHDNKTLVYRADVPGAEISAGSNNITYRPSVDYVINQRFNMSLYYDTNITKPYTSQAYNTAYSNFGINLKLLLQ